eukprot:gene18832-20728_t
MVEDHSEDISSIITSPRYIQRRQTVPATLNIDHHEQKTLTEALKKIWKDYFSRKDLKKVQDDSHSGVADSPRSLTRKMKNSRKSSVTEEDMLHYAISREEFKSAKHILEQGTVDVNSMRPPGVSALHEACAIGNLQFIKLLLKHDANIEQKTWQEQSPLQIATYYGHFEAAELLLENGANMEDIIDGF